MKINGVELPDLDVCELSVMENYEAAHDVVLEKVQNMEQTGKRRSELIKYQCEVIFEFFDTVFGEGTSNKVFGESCNLRTCLNAYEEICVAVNQLDKDYGAQVKNHFANQNSGKKKGKKGKKYNHYKKPLTVVK